MPQIVGIEPKGGYHSSRPDGLDITVNKEIELYDCVIDSENSQTMRIVIAKGHGDGSVSYSSEDIVWEKEVQLSSGEQNVKLGAVLEPGDYMILAEDTEEDLLRYSDFDDTYDPPICSENEELCIHGGAEFRPMYYYFFLLSFKLPVDTGAWVKKNGVWKPVTGLEVI